MDAILIALSVFVALLAFAMTAVQFGTDSRETLPDDWAR
jgi:hypothetical protein